MFAAVECMWNCRVVAEAVVVVVETIAVAVEAIIAAVEAAAAVVVIAEAQVAAIAVDDIHGRTYLVLIELGCQFICIYSDTALAANHLV